MTLFVLFYTYIVSFSSLFNLSLTMASQFFLHISHLSSGHVESDFESGDSMRVKASALHTSKMKWKIPKNYGITRNNHLNRYLLKDTLLYKPTFVPAMSSSDTDQQNADDDQPEAKANTFAIDIEYSRIDCLVYVLHDAAKSVLDTIQRHESARRHPELAMAWIGVDVHLWRKKFAYQVAVYALLKAAIAVELFLSHKRNTNASVFKILYPVTRSLGKRIEDQLKFRSPNLVQWFKTVELPRIAGLFFPMFKKWSMDYAGSGVAGIILVISCCLAVIKLGSGRLSCPSVSLSIEIILMKLINWSYTLVSVGKLHHLASEAGFEKLFLLHFGTKILPCKKIEDIVFWIGLVQKKLSVAFHRESVISGQPVFCDKDQENDLAVLGLFAFLGKETRVFLSRMKIKDLDEEVDDFLSYLECGSLSIYPRFSLLPEYQLFMEVVTDELGWLEFYAEYYWKFYPNKRRSRKRTIQAKKEMILNTVLTVCYDVFVGFAHYVTRTQRPLNSTLRVFLLRSQSLLAICLEYHRAAYGRSGEPVRMPEGAVDEFTTSCKAFSERRPRYPKSESIYATLLSTSTSKLKSASTDIWMGTQLFCADVSVSANLVMKRLRGGKVTEREKNKMARTLADIGTLIPVTILMLIPVSAWAHAAVLTAITRYIPALIPSPYSSERLSMVKQLERMKEMETQAWRNVEETEEDGSSSSADNTEETDPPDQY